MTRFNRFRSEVRDSLADRILVVIRAYHDSLLALGLTEEQIEQLNEETATNATAVADYLLSYGFLQDYFDQLSKIVRRAQKSVDVLEEVVEEIRGR